MATIAALNVLIRADSKQLSRDLRQARYVARRSFGNMRRDFSQISRQFLTVAAAASAAIIGIGKTSLTLADEIAKQARNINVSVREYQKLKLEAELAGISQEDLRNGIQQVTRVIFEATRGSSNYIDALGRIGLSYKDLALLSPAQQFTEVILALQRYGDQADRLAILLAILPEVGKKLGSILDAEGFGRAGDALERVNGIISEDLTTAAEKFNDRVTITLTALRNQLAVGFLTALSGENSLFGSNLFEQRLRQVGDVVREIGRGFAEVFSIDRLFEYRNAIRNVIIALIALKVASLALAAVNLVKTIGLWVIAMINLSLVSGVVAVKSIKAFAAAVGTLVLRLLIIPAIFAVIIAAIASVVHLFVRVGVAISNVFTDIQAVVDALLSVSVASFQSAAETIRNFFIDVFRLVLQRATAFLAGIQVIVRNLLILVNGAITKLNLALIALGLNTISNVNVNVDISESARTLLANLPEASTTAARALDEAQADFARAFDMLSSNLGDEFSGIPAKLRSDLTNFKTLVTDSISSGFAAVRQALGLTPAGALSGAGAGVDRGSYSRGGALIGGATFGDGGLGQLLDPAVVFAGVDWEKELRNSLVEPLREGVHQLARDVKFTLTDALATGDFSDVGEALTRNLNRVLAEAALDVLFQQTLGRLPFFEGIFHNSGIVGGTGDVPVLARAGELILNEAHQGVIANRLSQPTLSVTFNVTGDVNEATRRAIRQQMHEIAQMINADNYKTGRFAVT